jgi:hypothetical protein
MTEQQIKHMVDRFLGWNLPEHFNPDDGISFDPIASKGTPYEFRRTPSGTNLFSADQADAMVRHMIEGMPQTDIASGLTDDELAIIELSAKLWNAFLALPDHHPADCPELALDIHRIQNRVMARAAKRAHPETFR